MHLVELGGDEKGLAVFLEITGSAKLLGSEGEEFPDASLDHGHGVGVEVVGIPPNVLVDLALVTDLRICAVDVDDSKRVVAVLDLARIEDLPDVVCDEVLAGWWRSRCGSEAIPCSWRFHCRRPAWRSRRT